MKTVTELAQRIADQEMEACCEWIRNSLSEDPQEVAQELRDARRPNPPSLKERASQVVDWLIEGGRLNDDDAIVLRQLVESLPS